MLQKAYKIRHYATLTLIHEKPSVVDFYKGRLNLYLSIQDRITQIGKIQLGHTVPELQLFVDLQNLNPGVSFYDLIHQLNLETIQKDLDQEAIADFQALFGIVNGVETDIFQQCWVDYLNSYNTW